MHLLLLTHCQCEKENTKSIDGINLEEVYDLPSNPDKVQYLAYVMVYNLFQYTVKCLKETPLSYTTKCNYEMVSGISTEYYKKNEFAFKNMEGKPSEKLHKNSDENDLESDGHTNIDN